MKGYNNKKRGCIFQNRIVFIVLLLFILVGFASPAFSITGAFNLKGVEEKTAVQYDMDDANLILGNFAFGSDHFIHAMMHNEKNELVEGGFPLAKMFVPGLLICMLVSLALAVFMIVPIKGLDKTRIGKAVHYILPGVFMAVCAGFILYYSYDLQGEVMEAIKVLDANGTPGKLTTTTGVWPILNCITPLVFIALGAENTFKKEA